MSVFEILSIIAISIGGLWAAGAALISLHSRTKERAETAEQKSLTDSVESVRSLSRDTRLETMNSIKSLIVRIENLSTELFTKFHSADKLLTKHEQELLRIMEKATDQQREFSREFDRVWKAIADGQSSVKELGEGLQRVTGHRKKD